MADDGGQLEVFVAGGRTGFAPGVRIEVTVLWVFDRAPASLELRLFWITRGKGTEDLEVVATEPVPAREAAGEHACTFTLAAAPWSFSGRLISLVWGVEAVARGPDRTAAREFVVAPGGAEIQLHESGGAPGGATE